MLNLADTPQKGVRLRTKLESLVGVGFCAGAAIVLSLLLNDDAEVSLVAPFVCLFVVTMTAFFWGRVVAIIGAVAANLTFCLYLFPPRWSIKVSNPVQRIAVVVFQLLAVAAVFLAPRRIRLSKEAILEDRGAVSVLVPTLDSDNVSSIQRR